MTTASDDSLPYRPFKERMAEFMGHFGLWVYLVWGVSFFIYFGVWYLDMIQVGVTLALLVALFIGEFQHSRMMCWRCMKNVPLDPEQSVKDHDLALRQFHWRVDNKWKPVAVILAVWIIPLLIGIFITLPRPWSAVWSMGIVAVNMHFYYIQNNHQWLRPWCPMCKRWGRGDDGDHEPSPEPVPSGENEKVA